MKKIFICGLCIIIFSVLCSSLSVYASPVLIKEGDFQYELSDDDTLTLMKYSGDEENIVIPEEVQGYSVTAVSQIAFLSSNSVNSITYSENISNVSIILTQSSMVRTVIVLNSQAEITINNSSLLPLVLSGYNDSTTEEFAENYNIYKFVPLHEHTFAQDYTLIREATCRYDEIKCRICTYNGCNYGTDYVTTPTTIEHTPGSPVRIEPTCKATGSITVKCTVCGKQLSRISLPKSNHIPCTENLVLQDPTCSDYGIKGNTCIFCGMWMNLSEISKAEHTYSYTVKTGNYPCYEDTRIWKCCGECGLCYDEVVIPKTEHTPGNWIIITPPTQSSTGVKGKRCTVCGTITENEALGAVNPEFIDVKAGDWYYNAMIWAVGCSYMKGVSDTQFGASLPCTRAMLVTILWRMSGSPEPEISLQSGMRFTDVSDNWYTKAVLWAAENGIVYGISERAFSPDTPVTRQQMLHIIMKYAQYMGISTDGEAFVDKFNDSADIAPWALRSVSWALSQKLINGRDNNLLLPQAAATRAEIATVLRAFDKSKK